MTDEENAKIVLAPIVIGAWRYCDMVDLVAQALRNARLIEREACAKLVETEGECRHVDHVQGFCACQSKADAIRARSISPPASGASQAAT